MLPALGAPALFAWCRMPRVRAFRVRSRGILCVGRRLHRLRHQSDAASCRQAFSSSCHTVSRTLGAPHPYSPQPTARPMARARLDWTLAPAGRPRAAPLPRSAYADGSRRSNSQISLKSRACCAVCAAGAGRSLCADRCAECCADPAGRPRAAPLPRSAYADGSQCSELPIALENRV